jgi:hypothetical protein
MAFYLIMYFIYGVLVFLSEWSGGSGFWFSFFIGVAYPVTILFGAIGWVVFGIYKLFTWISKRWVKLRSAT